MNIKLKLDKKPVTKKLGENIDFFGLFCLIEETYETCFLLESLKSPDQSSRYSLIGFSPEKIISAKDNKLYIDQKSFSVENPYLELSKIFPQTQNFGQGYNGGLVGYLGYESVNYFEPSLSLQEHQDFETFKFGLYLDGVILDRMTGEVSYFFHSNDRSEEVKELIKKLHNYKLEKMVEVGFLGDNLTPQEHKKMVEKTKEEIKKGNIFQAEVGFKTRFKIEGSLSVIYKELREVNPSPFMYYLKFRNQKMLGASPELLFSLADGIMETFPLAGTVKRGSDKIEDTNLARELLNNKKEIAEHNMLVDLHRNDLGRVAKFGTVKVKRLMDIKKFSHVQHISSEIMGILNDAKYNMFDALASNFPAGTLSGSPKIEAIKIIADNEKTARGPYGGAVGYFGFNGNCDFCIPIRSLFVNNKDAYAQTSGGIVYDSKNENEYQEIINKLAAMKKVLKKFQIN